MTAEIASRPKRQRRGHAVVVARWIGVDVGGKRKGFDVAVIDGRGLVDLRGRCDRDDVLRLVDTHQPVLVAIDSPRSCALEGQRSRDGERQLASAICGIRWTPDRERVHANGYYAWIVEGLGLFEALLARKVTVIEVFPTASWTRSHGKRGRRSRAAWSTEGLVALGLDGVPARTNQDQRDAIAAAVTARQHTYGMTQTFGEIVVPTVSRPAPARL